MKSLMDFKFSDGAYFAQNSLKPVRITEFEEGVYELFMLKGSTEDQPLTSLLFDTFDKAVRHAECYIGMSIEFK